MTANRFSKTRWITLSSQSGSWEEEVDLSLLTDGLRAERNRALLDVAQVFYLGENS
jgi:sulfate adenylyltransferase subunit 1 (EFTu-like GTPase family)